MKIDVNWRHIDALQVVYISLPYDRMLLLIPEPFSVCSLQMYLSSTLLRLSWFLMPCSMIVISRSFFRSCFVLQQCLAKSQLSGLFFMSYLWPPCVSLIVFPTNFLIFRIKDYFSIEEIQPRLNFEWKMQTSAFFAQNHSTLLKHHLFLAKVAMWLGKGLR